MRNKVFIILLAVLFCSKIYADTVEYVNLGLSSGTLWKNKNETGLYTPENALIKFGLNLPSTAQLTELMEECTWEWKGKGFKITGPNGNYIFLPAAGMGMSDEEHRISGIGDIGNYVSTSGYYLHFSIGERGTTSASNYYTYSVRLVKSMLQ